MSFSLTGPQAEALRAACRATRINPDFTPDQPNPRSGMEINPQRPSGLASTPDSIQSAPPVDPFKPALKINIE